MEAEEKMKMLQALVAQNPGMTVILEQHNEHNIGNVEAGGIGIQINHGAPAAPDKPATARRRKRAGTKATDGVFIYRYCDEEDGMGRLALLYQKLLKAEWIHEDTKPNDFVGIFCGKPSAVKVKWTGAQSLLFALINELESRQLISCTAGARKWEVTGNRFLDKNSRQFDHWNSQKTPKKYGLTIQHLADLLDPAAASQA